MKIEEFLRFMDSVKVYDLTQNLSVTDIAVIKVTEEGLLLKEVAPGWTPEEVQALTEPKLIIAPDLKDYEL